MLGEISIISDMLGPLFEGNPVGEGTTRRGTATPVSNILNIDV